MKASKIKASLVAAKKAMDKMNSHCYLIEKELQEYFKSEVTVFWQPSDGFVILQDEGASKAPRNYSVEEVLTNLAIDKKYYL